jgi:hypothetical protein
MEENKTVDIKELKTKAANISSRISSYEWKASDYDRSRSKGAFFKKFPSVKAILDTLYEEQVSTENKITHAQMATDFASEKSADEPELVY